jgi:hypothetical protein
MIKLIDEFEKQPPTDDEHVFVGYFILNNEFNIIHVPEGKHLGDAMTKAMNSIVLPEINKYYTPFDGKITSTKKTNVVDNTEGELK